MKIVVLSLLLFFTSCSAYYNAPKPLVTGKIVVSEKTAQNLDDKGLLFIALKNPAGGPPWAAKKYRPSHFPFSFVVDQEDLLFPGTQLGAGGLLVVRWDVDGNLETTSKKDLRQEVMLSSFAGPEVEIVLDAVSTSPGK